MSCEAVTVGGSALLAIENAGDHGVGVMDSEATHQRDGVFISAHGCGTTLQVEINLDDGATTPTQGEMHAVLLFVEGDDDFFEQGAQQFLLSRGAVVGACQTLNKSVPSASKRLRSSTLSIRGRCCSRRASSALAVSNSRSAFSHSASSPRATSRLSGSTARYRRSVRCAS